MASRGLFNGLNVKRVLFPMGFVMPSKCRIERDVDFLTDYARKPRFGQPKMRRFPIPCTQMAIELVVAEHVVDHLQWRLDKAQCLHMVSRQHGKDFRTLALINRRIALQEQFKVGDDHSKNAARKKDAAYLTKETIGIWVIDVLDRMVGIDAFPRIFGEPERKSYINRSVRLAI